MLKLPKGLKKKKNKKSKKNQELFTEEELEQFKREQKAKQLAEQEEAERQAQLELEGQQHHSASTSKPKTEDDEWSKFTQLTSGIDSILKKTQGELERIKEQSFYQRVEPPKPKPEVKLPEKEEEPPQPQLTEEELIEQRKLEALKAAVVELSDTESESDEADDIFDTNYIDELAAGNLLAYVPESPDEEDLGPDPFDTNFAEKVIKGPEVSKRGKKIVNIGSAVEVLTGRVDNVALNKEALKRPRRGPQNLLLSSFDQDPEPAEENLLEELKSEIVKETPVLSLLDDPTDIISDVPIDLSTSLHLDFYKKKQEEEREAERLRRELERDEFDELAEESLTKKTDVIVVDPSSIKVEPLPVEAGDWKSEFEVQAELGIVDVYDDDLEAEEDVDPFDTQFVATVVREKSIDDDDFDPRADEQPISPEKIKKIEPIYKQPTTLAVKPKDLLSGSTSDLTDLSHIPVISASESIEVEIDPFDTSAISALVQPKEIEIKYLEKELLSDVGLKHSLSDPDFDPRSDERVVQPQALSTAERKSSLSLNIAQPFAKTVAFDVSGGLAVDNVGGKKPVTPYYTDKAIAETADISDSEFDPRAVTPKETNNQDLLSVGEANINIKVLTPAASIDPSDEFAVEDPFDTSNASALLLPGKAELKLIENEFIDPIQSTESTNVLDINSYSQELGLGGKV